MTTRTFAPWVEPIAAQLRESRRGIVEVARTIPEGAWSRPSHDPGWSYRDLLTHLAVGDWVCQAVLRAAGVRAATITDIETGKRPPRPSTRRKLAKALGVRPQDIDW